MLLVSSCSLHNKMSRKKAFLEAHGGFALTDANKLPRTCDERFPCITTEKETSDSTWSQRDSANQAVIDSLRRVADSMQLAKGKVFVITDSASCQKAIAYYKNVLATYANQVNRLSNQVKESTTTYNRRLEKNTVESTAKLKAMEVERDAALKDVSRLTQQLQKVTQDRDAEKQKREAAEDLAKKRLWLMIKIGAVLVFLGLMLFKLKVIRI